MMVLSWDSSTAVVRLSGDWDEDGKLFKFALLTGGTGKRTPGSSEGHFFAPKVCHYTFTILTYAVIFMCDTCSDIHVFTVC